MESLEVRPVWTCYMHVKYCLVWSTLVQTIYLFQVLTIAAVDTIYTLHAHPHCKPLCELAVIALESYVYGIVCLVTKSIVALLQALKNLFQQIFFIKYLGIIFVEVMCFIAFTCFYIRIFVFCV